jgi:hypothetical protein
MGGGAQVAAWVVAALVAGAAPTLGYVYASPQDTHGRYYVPAAEGYVVEVATGTATDGSGAFLAGGVVFRVEPAAADGKIDWKVEHALAPGTYAVHAGSRSGGTVAWSPTTTFVVAEGCRVPPVRGRTVAAARAALRSAGCTLGGARRVRSRIRRGLVAGTSPRAGLLVPKGAPIVLLVSRGRG